MSRPLGYFEGLADEPIPEDSEDDTLGWSKTRWMTDPDVRNAPLDDHHFETPVGHVVYPYIGRSVDDPNKEMNAFRGALHLDNERGKALHERVKRGDPDLGLSIHYTCFANVGTGKITGRKFNGIGLHSDRRNPHCRITVRQGNDPSTVSFVVPVRVLGITKAEPTLGLRFPSFTSNPQMASTTAPSGSAPPAPAQTAPAPAPSPAPAQAPPTPAPAPASNTTAAGGPQPMEVDLVTSAAAAVQKMTAEQRNQKAVEALLYDKEMTELRAFKEAALKADVERQKTEADLKWKTFGETHKDLLPDLGLTDEQKADPALVATLKYIVNDPSAQVVHQLLTTALGNWKKERDARGTLEKQREEQTMIVETLKKARGNAPAAFAIKDEKPTIPASATQQLATEAKKAQATTGSVTLLHPAAQALRFPQSQIVASSRTGVTMMTPVGPAGGAPPMAQITQPIAVQQGAGGGPSTGDSVSSALQPYASDPKVANIMNAFNTGDPNLIRAPNGMVYDRRMLCQNQEKMAGGTMVFASDNAALASVALNRGMGQSMAPVNYYGPDDLKKNAKRTTAPV